jgi:hypothetical protein
MWSKHFPEPAMSRLTIDLTKQQHQSLKALAALQGKTIRQYTVERLFPDGADEDSAWQELQSLLGMRIAEGLEGKVSAKGFDAIVEEEMGRDSRA